MSEGQPKKRETIHITTKRVRDYEADKEDYLANLPSDNRRAEWQFNTFLDREMERANKRYPKWRRPKSTERHSWSMRADEYHGQHSYKKGTNPGNYHYGKYNARMRRNIAPSDDRVRRVRSRTWQEWAPVNRTQNDNTWNNLATAYEGTHGNQRNLGQIFKQKYERNE